MLKVLIIGLGSIATKHISALRKINQNVKIYALRSFSPAEEIDNVLNVYNLDAFEIEQIDFIIISNPTSEHYQTIKNLVSYQKPLFIEKPLFSKLDNATAALVEELEKKNIPTYVACNLRFLDALVELRLILKTERINEVNAYCGSYLPNWRPGKDFRKIYSANKDMGGGVHIDLIHELDYVFWLFGEPLKTSSFFSNVSSLDITAYDYANYLWIYPEFSASIILNYYRKESKRTLEILTDNGTYLVDLLQNRLMFNQECIFETSKRIADTYDDQMKFYINSILQNKQKFNNVTEANNVLKLCMQD